MYQKKPSKAFSPFVDASLPSTAELIEFINADVELPVVRRRNLKSSVRRFCKARGRPPEQLPANHHYFRAWLKRFHPSEAKIKPKRWQTIQSDVSFALHRMGITEGQTRGLAPFSPEWSALIEQLPAGHFTWGLSRLGRFCSTLEIAPDGVNDRVMTSFDQAIRRETFKTDPDQLYRDVCLRWNQAVAMLPDAALNTVSLPCYEKNLTEPWETLPASFRAEADAWLQTLSKEADLLSEDGPIKPLRPASIVSYRYTLRQAFAALVATGTAPATITALEVLVCGDNPKTALGFYLDRNSGETSSMIHTIAHVLVLVAIKCERDDRATIDQATVDKLKRFRKQLALGHTGLRPRPQRGLRQFTDKDNIEKILCLPLRIYDRIRLKSVLTKKDALLMQVAVALELLLMRPMRRKNVVELRLDESVIRCGRETFIHWPSDQVKNTLDLHHKILKRASFC